MYNKIFVYNVFITIFILFIIAVFFKYYVQENIFLLFFIISFNFSRKRQKIKSVKSYVLRSMFTRMRDPY